MDRHRRRKHGIRAKTLAARFITRRSLRAEALTLLPGDLDYERPQIRRDCLGKERPCPYVGCKWHLYLDVDKNTGSIKFNFPDLQPEDLKHSCALDVADVGGVHLEDIGEVMNLTRERIRQLEERALKKMARARGSVALREHYDPEAPVRRLPVLVSP